MNIDIKAINILCAEYFWFGIVCVEYRGKKQSFVDEVFNSPVIYLSHVLVIHFGLFDLESNRDDFRDNLRL